MHRNTLVTVPPGLPPGHPQSYIASDPAELCTFEYTWSTAEEGTSSPGNLDERVDSHEVLRSGIPPQLISWLS